MKAQETVMKEYARCYKNIQTRLSLNSYLKNISGDLRFKEYCLNNAVLNALPLKSWEGGGE